ncbi:MAG TPA: ATP-binding cassette domain-containing protein [Jiangellales bacterium]|nr:ATP-binding cassette domain-containing protein [Jiangellales bacterium]
MTTADLATRGLVVSGLSVRLGRHPAVDGVSFGLAPGRVLAVTGPSGSGKTTVLSAVAGLVRPESGSIGFAGAPVRVGDRAHARRTGLVLQGYGLLSVLTAAENVEVALQTRGVTRSEVLRATREVLDRLGLDQTAERLVEELSGGQRQRVAVARALVTEPDLLLADEPTAELDVVTRDLVVAQLRAEAERGAVVVVATHDPDVAAACDEELHLVDGRAVTH